MRNIYIAVGLFFIIGSILFIGAFIFLDKSGHKTYHYMVNLEGNDVGTIKIDRYQTEGKIIYKATSEEPFEDILTSSKTRLELDKNYILEAYSQERYGGASEKVYLENKDSSISFLSKFDSRFIYIDNIPIKKETFIFEERSPITYLPIIENYNFKKGKSQGFNALTCFSKELPPIKRLITLTSIRDEYLTIEKRKIKTENLLLKIRNYPQGKIWVAKSDRRLIRLEMPKEGLTITRQFYPIPLKAKKYNVDKGEYAVRKVIFKNKNVGLSGTLTIPKGEGKKPAVLLIWGRGPQDSDYQGLFSSIAYYLSNQGFCVLSFDKRGIRSSEGDHSSYSHTDEIDDLSSAVEYLSTVEEVDPKRIAVIGHSDGAFGAMKLASEKGIIKTAILMSPSLSLGFINEERLKNIASKAKWPDDYLRLVMRSMQETEKKVKDSKHNWISILRERCFVKSLKEELAERPVDVIGKVRIPVLILQGKKDDSDLMGWAEFFDRALGDSGNSNHILRYYGYLGHFLGTKVIDGVHKMHYEADRAFLGDMADWLKDSLPI